MAAAPVGAPAPSSFNSSSFPSCPTRKMRGPSSGTGTMCDSSTYSRPVESQVIELG
jgi:hypothetical protein